jgi:hypothetical protein
MLLWQAIVVWGLLMSVSGLGTFIYDYQTLIGSGVALLAAYVAVRPVWRQVALTQTQSNGVLREMLLERKLEIEQAKVDIRENVSKPIIKLASALSWYKQGELMDEQSAHAFDRQLSTALTWLTEKYRWRDSEAVEQKKQVLILELTTTIDILNDIHAPAHTDQHDEERSMSDENWQAFINRGQEAKTLIKAANKKARSAHTILQETMDIDLEAIQSRLRKLDATLITSP